MKKDTKEIQELLKRFPLFEGVEDKSLALLADRAELLEVRKDKPIYNSGEVSDHLYLITKGTVKIYGQIDHDREVVKQVLHPISMFGECCLTGEENRQHTARSACTAVQLLVIHKVYLQHFMRKDGKLMMRFLNFIGGRLQAAEDRLESLIFKDARARVIDFLKQSAAEQGMQVGFETLVRHVLTQQDIANMAGTSRQTVTTVLNDLRKANLIRFSRHRILIRDMAKLA